MRQREQPQWQEQETVVGGFWSLAVSVKVIGQVTEVMMKKVRAGQSQPLEPLYMTVHLDALLVRMRHRWEKSAVFAPIG